MIKSAAIGKKIALSRQRFRACVTAVDGHLLNRDVIHSALIIQLSIPVQCLEKRVSRYNMSSTAYSFQRRPLKRQRIVRCYHVSTP